MAGVTLNLPLTWMVLIGVGSPALLRALLGATSLAGRSLPERWVGSLAAGAMTVSFLAVLVAFIVHGATGTGPRLLSYGAWSASHDGGLTIEFLVDRL